jgi:pilus assembly protein Flp/PilA
MKHEGCVENAELRGERSPRAQIYAPLTAQPRSYGVPPFKRGRGNLPAEKAALNNRGVLGGIDVTKVFSRFLADENGATAIEYALIAMGIAVAIVASVAAVSEAVKGKFDLVEASLQ